MLPNETSAPSADIAQVFRESYGRAVAVLVRAFGDIDAAEEAVQDAFMVATERWSVDGVPPSPAGWIVTTAKNRAINRLPRTACNATASTCRRRCAAAADATKATRRGPCT